MAVGRVAMFSGSENTVPYVAFDGYVTYKPKAGKFRIYLQETGEATEVDKLEGALITRRNVALASSLADNMVSSQDFDGFSEKLTFRENIKGGSVIAKDLTYAEAKDEQHKYFAAASFRLGSVYYLVTEKGGVLKLTLTGTTRSKVNEALDALGDIDFVTFNVADETVTVGGGSRKQDVYELSVTNTAKEYTRVAVDKINEVVNKCNEIMEYKKTGKSTADAGLTAEEAEGVFSSDEDDSGLPI